MATMVQSESVATLPLKPEPATDVKTDVKTNPTPHVAPDVLDVHQLQLPTTTRSSCTTTARTTSLLSLPTSWARSGNPPLRLTT
jgi:hypothetical protein